MLSHLTRFHLSLVVAFSALAGYLLYPAEPGSLSAFLLFVGVWLLSSGASALNQVQERNVDALMSRTMGRPLVTGKISVSSGLLIAVALITGGLFALAVTGGKWVVMLGLFSLFWYNGVYTYLKKVTPFAVLPGSLCGSLPPIMGWVLAGGGITDYPILLLALIIVLWQVPHFWLLVLSYPEDYSQSGFPDLLARIQPEQLKRLSIVWILALLAGIAWANLAGFLHADVCRVGIVIGMLLLAGALLRYHQSNSEPAASIRLFMQLNLFMTFCLFIIAIDGFSVSNNLMTFF